MLINTNLDPRLKIKKPEDIIELPVVVKVNQFNESAVATFNSQFQAAVSSGQPVIPIFIDSYGGACYSLLSMIDTIRSSKVPVATFVSGKAMSCGALLLSFGTEGYRFAAASSRVMIHEVSTGAFGKVEEVKADAKEADFLNTSLYEMMAENCGKPKSYFLDLMHEKKHADWYLSAQEAKKHGLVNHIRVPEFTLNITADIKFG